MPSPANERDIYSTFFSGYRRGQSFQCNEPSFSQDSKPFPMKMADCTPASAYKTDYRQHYISGNPFMSSSHGSS